MDGSTAGRAGFDYSYSDPGDWNRRAQASQRSLELFKTGCFCSGISRAGGMYGTVSGAIMGINLVGLPTYPPLFDKFLLAVSMGFNVVTIWYAWNRG